MTLKRKLAFTLAEVLITLGIIGVVAAITMPMLIQNYQKTVYVNQLKKSVSTLEQGFQKMLADEGVERLSDLPNLKNWNNIFDFEERMKDITDTFLKKGFYVTYKKAPGYLLDASEINNEDSYTSQIQFNDGGAMIDLWSNGNNAYHHSSENCSRIKAQGGTMCSCFMQFMLDVNGVKGPNKLGRDIFYFYVSDEGKLYPRGGKDHALYYSPGSSLDSNIEYWKNGGCSLPGYNNFSCAGRIIENGWNMDY